MPTSPGEITATLTRKFNEVCSTVDDLKEHLTSLKLQHGKVSQGSSDVRQMKPTYSIILKQPPKGLDDKKAVTTLINAVKDAKLKSPLHFGIVGHIPDDATDTDLCSMIENW